MGGSILFTSSGTFSPSVYGLTTGKFINYIIIGGGGAGQSIGCFKAFTFNGTSASERNSFVLNSGGSNGGTSSIGSYVSATGGSTSTKTGSSYYYFCPDSFNKDNYSLSDIYGGSGAGGWVPGKIFNSYQSGYSPTAVSSSTSLLPSYINALTYDGQKFLYMHSFGGSSSGDMGSIVAYNPSTNNASTYGGGTPNPYNLIQNAGTSHQGSDGIGYGSGGGGCENIHSYDSGSNRYYTAGKGGSSGQFKQGSFKLTSTNDIAITIGAGGKPHTTMGSPFTSVTALASGDTNYWQSGRIGTQGAAMLFWD